MLCSHMYTAYASSILFSLYYPQSVADRLGNMSLYLPVKISVLASLQMAIYTSCLYDPCCVSYNDCVSIGKCLSAFLLACLFQFFVHVFKRMRVFWIRVVRAQRVLAGRSHPGGHARQRDLRGGGPRPQQALPHHAGSLWGWAVGSSCPPHQASGHDRKWWSLSQVKLQ